MTVNAWWCPIYRNLQRVGVDGRGDCGGGGGVNRLDTMQRKGKAKPPPGITECLGLEVAGKFCPRRQANLTSVPR